MEQKRIVKVNRYVGEDGKGIVLNIPSNVKQITAVRDGDKWTFNFIVDEYYERIQAKKNKV